MIWVSLRAVKLSDGRSLEYLLDITERKQAELILRTERDWFAKIVSTVPVVICSFRQRLDGDWCFPFATPAIEHIYGLVRNVREDAASIFTRMHPDDVDAVLASLAESARTMTAWRAEFRVRNPAGQAVGGRTFGSHRGTKRRHSLAGSRMSPSGKELRKHRQPGAAPGNRYRVHALAGQCSPMTAPTRLTRTSTGSISGRSRANALRTYSPRPGLRSNRG